LFWAARGAAWWAARDAARSAARDGARRELARREGSCQVSEWRGWANGAGLLLATLAEWVCSENAMVGGCTGFVCRVDGRLWVGRNKDYWLGDL